MRRSRASSISSVATGAPVSASSAASVASDPGPGVDQRHVEVEPHDRARPFTGRTATATQLACSPTAAGRVSVVPPAYGPRMKTRTVHRCSECGVRVAPLARALPGVRRVGHPGRTARRPRRRRRRRGSHRADGPVPIGEVDARGAIARAHRRRPSSTACSRAGSCRARSRCSRASRAWARARCCCRRSAAWPPAARACLLVTAEESCAQVTPAGRAGRRPRPRPARRGRDLAARTCSPTSTRSRPGARGRLDPDRRRSRPPGCAGLGHAGARRAPTGSCSTRRSASLATVLVGHVTKEGTLAGPRVLEHVVDTVLSFDGDRGHSLRAAPRAEAPVRRHRRGRAVRDDRARARRRARRVGALPRRPPPGVPGSAVAAVLEGARPMLVEVQALVMTTGAPMPRRSAAGHGVGAPGHAARRARAARRGAASTGADVYASVAGGLRVTERGLDLALALAVAGAHLGRGGHRATRSRSASSGLGGEVRSVPQLERRLAEAARLGFTRAVVPKGARHRGADVAGSSCVGGHRACAHAVGARADPCRLILEIVARPAVALVAARRCRAPERKSPSCPPHRDRKP